MNPFLLACLLPLAHLSRLVFRASGPQSFSTKNRENPPLLMDVPAMLEYPLVNIAGWKIPHVQ